MDNSSHEYMEAQSGHGPCLKIGSTRSTLYKIKYIKIQNIPRFSVF